MTQPLNEQDFNDEADLDLIQSELEDWAEYWGSKDTSKDEAVEALQRIRNRVLELKGGDPLADVKAQIKGSYVHHVSTVLTYVCLVAAIVIILAVIEKFR